MFEKIEQTTEQLSTVGLSNFKVSASADPPLTTSPAASVHEACLGGGDDAGAVLVGDTGRKVTGEAERLRLAEAGRPLPAVPLRRLDGRRRVVKLVVVVRAEDFADEVFEVEAFSGLLACEGAREARQRP